MSKDAATVFSELKKDVTTYIELKLELLKLNTYERAANVIAVLSQGVVLLLLAFFVTLFLALALGFYIGDQLGNTALGFLIVAGIYALLFFLIILNKNRIRTRVSNTIIDTMMSKDEKHDEPQPTDTH